MKIILDPGHGGRDPGAIGVPLADRPDGMEPNERLQEKDVTLNVSLLAAAALRELGYTVLLTREADVDVPLQTRTGMALAEQVDAYISIHANAGGGTGSEVWYQDGDESSRAFAAALVKGIYDMELVPNRGLKVGSAATRTNWYTFSQLANDALLELAFLDHEKRCTAASAISRAFCPRHCAWNSGVLAIRRRHPCPVHVGKTATHRTAGCHARANVWGINVRSHRLGLRHSHSQRCQAPQRSWRHDERRSAANSQ